MTIKPFAEVKTYRCLPPRWRPNDVEVAKNGGIFTDNEKDL